MKSLSQTPAAIRQRRYRANRKPHESRRAACKNRKSTRAWRARVHARDKTRARRLQLTPEQHAASLIKRRDYMHMQRAAARRTRERESSRTTAGPRRSHDGAICVQSRSNVQHTLVGSRAPAHVSAVALKHSALKERMQSVLSCKTQSTPDAAAVKLAIHTRACLRRVNASSKPQQRPRYSESLRHKLEREQRLRAEAAQIAARIDARDHAERVIEAERDVAKQKRAQLAKHTSVIQHHTPVIHNVSCRAPPRRKPRTRRTHMHRQPKLTWAQALFSNSNAFR